jgi:hypothetical protein
MRVPQVSERIKEAPAQALRGVFAGIGQLLLITDKIRNKTSHQDVPRARTPTTSGTVTDAAVTSPAGQDAGTAAPPAETAAAKPNATRPATARRTAAKPAAGKPVSPKPAAKPVTAKPPTARRATVTAAAADSAGEAPKPPKRQSTRDLDKTGNVRLIDGETPGAAVRAAPGAPPLPNYDELSVASLRARLRNLDVTQVRQLAEYERAHAARAEVLTMFERRIAKLEAEA